MPVPEDVSMDMDNSIDAASRMVLRVPTGRLTGEAHHSAVFDVLYPVYDDMLGADLVRRARRYGGVVCRLTR